MICGRFAIDKNTVHIRFNGAEGELTQLAEFQYEKPCEEHEFALKKVTGPQSVPFVFLPGSKFDFKWFRFVTADD